MSIIEKTMITVETIINAPIEKVWNFWTESQHIVHWNFATDDWQCPKAEQDLRQGGKFLYRMEAKDGSFGFDFWGVYDLVENLKRIESTLEDGRTLKVEFTFDGVATKVIETFEAETVNPIEMQKGGWQSILDNFKKYVESI